MAAAPPLTGKSVGMPRAIVTALLTLAALIAAAGTQATPLGQAVPDVSGAARVSTAPVTAGSWAWPLAAPHPVVRQFIAPATAYSAGHRGIDIRSPSADVFAPADGVVSFAGVVVDRPVLSIRHDDGVVSSYEPVETTLSAGDAVSRGQLVGTLLPGHCPGLCLHFGVRVGGQYVSPLEFLGGIPWSVLLPTRGG